jgi:outer membrane protein OmpA-like peptidoglycan-associated protein
MKMSDETAGTDWAADVKRYVPDADDGVIAKIENYCGIALRTRDASLVSFNDPAETDRVRENYCRKKLGLEEPDAVLNAAIASVGERMSDTTFRNRVTVYYLLAEHFGKLGLFGAVAATASAAAANDAEPADEPLAIADVHAPRRRAKGDGFLGLAALAFGAIATIMVVSAIAGSYIGGRFDKPAPVPTAAPVVAVAPVIPEGAGIVSEVIEGRPKVSVYFEVDKADVAPEFPAALAPVKAWLEAHPNDRVQFSGFTDPTGDAAANAVLAKRRAEAVAAELESEGIPADRVDLVKPADSSDETVDYAHARRVEVTVTGG